MAAVLNSLFGAGTRDGGFSETVPLHKRLEESQRVRSRYSDRIPVIVEKGRSTADIPVLEKTKFLVPSELSVGQLVYVIRSRLQLSPETAIFLYASKDGSALPTGSILRDIDDQYKSEDGFLYISYSGEATFG